MTDEQIEFPASTWRDVELCAWGSLGYAGTAEISTEWAVMTQRDLIGCDDKAHAETVGAETGGTVVRRTVIRSNWHSSTPPEYITTPRALAGGEPVETSPDDFDGIPWPITNPHKDNERP